MELKDPLPLSAKMDVKKGISTTAPWGELPAAPVLTLDYKGSFDCVGSFVSE